MPAETTLPTPSPRHWPSVVRMGWSCLLRMRMTLDPMSFACSEENVPYERAIGHYKPRLDMEGMPRIPLISVARASLPVADGTPRASVLLWHGRLARGLAVRCPR